MTISHNDTNIRTQVSDKMFIEWSKGTNDEDYDVLCVADYIDNYFPPCDLLYGLDVGGGTGTYANIVSNHIDNHSVHMTIVDPSEDTKQHREDSNLLSFIQADFTTWKPEKKQKYDFIIFRTVLHHLVQPTNKETTKTQSVALKKAKDLLSDNGVIIIVENFYESFLGSDTTGRLIFEITKLKSIEAITRKLGANTAGEGVRFRSHSSWEEIFISNGLSIESEIYSGSWGKSTPIWQNLPLMCKSRRQGVIFLTPIITS